MEDVFAIQDEISLAVTDALKVRLLHSDKAKVVKRHTVSFDAYRAYMKGRYHWFIRSSEDIEKAIKYLEEAVSIDPEYALAYAGLADCYGVLPMYKPIAPDEVHQKAKAAALRALELDDSLAEAHTALSCILDNYEWEWNRSSMEIEKAISLNPGYATAYHWKAEGLIARGRFDEAVRVMNKARELDPLSLLINTRMGLVLYYARRFEDAKTTLLTTLEVDPDASQARYFLSLVYVAEKRYQEAIELLTDESARSWVAVLHAWNGDVEKGRAMMEEVVARAGKGYELPCIRALFCLATGDIDGCFLWMSKAVETKDPRLPNIIRSPTMVDLVGSDPRYAETLERMGLQP